MKTPWKSHSNRVIVICDRDGNPIARVDDLSAANLLVTAPELLEALENLRCPGGCFCEAGVEMMDGQGVHTEECTQAMKAIAKAKAQRDVGQENGETP